MDARPQVESHELMDAFTARPEVARWIKGAQLEEYSAHIISEAGAKGMPALCTGGMLVAGDAAGFSLNMGVTVRGMEFAIASGVLAAEAANKALDKGDASKESLSLYERLLKESFAMKDMETFRHSREVLENPRLFTVYPKFICSLLEEIFTITEKPKPGLYGSAKKAAKKYLLNWEGFKDFLTLRKM